MRFQITTVFAMAVICSLGTGIVQAQNSAGSVPLGDLARQLKAEREKSAVKSKVYTNDNLPPPDAQSADSASKSSATPKEAKPGQQPDQGASTIRGGRESGQATSAETAEEPHGEKYFRKQMSKLQELLSIHERELNVLEQKLGQNQMMYYPDPNKGLLQESGPTAMADVNDLQARIAKKKDEIAVDQGAIENLLEQLRREGGDPEWFRVNKEVQEGPAASQPLNERQIPKEKKEEYWRAQFKSARARLADAEERQRLAEDELNLLQIQDARELDASVKAELAAKVKAKEGEIRQARAVTERARKNLEDLKNRFKASGAPEEWSEAENN